MKRVANQMSDEERAARADFVIYNGDSDEILPQILKLHEFFTGA
jgi:dephospho-CoA kinase